MRILFVVEHFYPYIGGAEELFLQLTASLAEKGNEVIVVTTLYDKSLKTDEIYKGINIKRVNCFNRFLFTIVSLPHVIKFAKQADLIQTTSYNSAFPSIIAGIFCGKKVIITFHEVWGKMWFKLPFTPRWKLVSYYCYEWLILKLPFFKFVAVSKSTRESLINNGISPERIEQIYNGLDYSLFENYHHQPPGDFTFCFFGRLGISKGLDLLLNATQVFVRDHPAVILKLIIPTQPTEIFRQIKELINKLNLHSNVILFHNLDKPTLLKEVATSSCVVIPSMSEGFCYVAVESAAMGVPVISSGKGSLPEVISGKFIEMKSLSVEDIVNCLNKAFQNEWEYKEPVKFELKNSVNSYLELYNTIIK